MSRLKQTPRALSRSTPEGLYAALAKDGAQPHVVRIFTAARATDLRIDVRDWAACTEMLLATVNVHADSPLWKLVQWIRSAQLVADGTKAGRQRLHFAPREP